MTGTVYTCLHTNQSRSYLNHLVLFEIICPASSHETCQLLEFPLNGLQAHKKFRPVVGLLPLASGQVFFWDGISSISDQGVIVL